MSDISNGSQTFPNSSKAVWKVKELERSTYTNVYIYTNRDTNGIPVDRKPKSSI